MNGMRMQKKHIELTLEKHLLEILLKIIQKITYLKILMFYVQDFHVKRFQLQGIKKDFMILEVHYFLT